MATFADRVQALATAVRRMYPPVEKESGFRSLIFNAEGRDSLEVLATPNNLASRLFVEALAREAFPIGYPPFLLDLNEFQTVAELFFGEYWNDKPGTGAHPIIDGFRGYASVRLNWKSDAKPFPKISVYDVLHSA